MSRDELRWLACEALEQLLAAGPVHLSAVGGGETALAIVTAYEGGKPRSASGGDLFLTILEAAGRPVTRRCFRCGLSKRLGEFSRWERDPLGRNASCKSCEKERVKKAKRAKKGQRT